MYFDYSGNKGIVSFLISHNQWHPSFIRNQFPSQTSQFNPRRTYIEWGSYYNSFETNINDYPYLIIDLVQYRVNIESYSFSIFQGNSPPIL